MGSSILICPMCCGETFNSSQSLKYHLLSMTDNLYCPSCSQRSDSVAALIQHLDGCGSGNNVTFEENVKEIRIGEGEVLMDTNVDQIHQTYLATVDDQTIMIVGGPKEVEEQDDDNYDGSEGIEIPEGISGDDYSDLQKIEEEADPSKSPTEAEEENAPVISIPETSPSKQSMLTMLPDEEFLDEDQNLITISQDDDPKEIGEEELLKIDASALYSCSSCGMGFNSVLDHIKQYHDGQEVVLEMAEVDANEEMAVEPSEPAEHAPKSKHRQKMNTLRTEECIDSEGRLYTRKVVQIEPFWNRSTPEPTAKPQPMIEKFFSNTEGVKTRQKIEVPPKIYRCNQCLEQFSRLNEFRTHVCINGTNHCDHCDQAFATIKALQVHMKVHDGDIDPTLFVCLVCGTQFSSHKSLRLHSRMHGPVRERHVDAPEGTTDPNFTCLECGKTFSESYRIAHMALHSGDSPTCGICNRKFDSAESLSMHAAVHSEVNSGQGSSHTPPSWVSPPTPPDGASKDAKEEKKEGSENSEKDPVDISKPYQCQHCGRRFTRPHEKVKHERIHTGEKPHACEVCGKTFRVSYCLTLHMRTHTGVRPYECKHCGKRFKASSVYNHHLLTHGDERAYKCPFCVKTFKTRVQLAGHKNSHTKPFRCTECSRPFASLYAARAHIATHKKDNNLKFSCFICGASYGRAFALNDHMKNHGSDAVPPPEPAREEEVQEDFLMEEEDISEHDLVGGIEVEAGGVVKKFECGE